MEDLKKLTNEITEADTSSSYAAQRQMALKTYKNHFNLYLKDDKDKIAKIFTPVATNVRF